jgi:UDP-GlcNAc:undecaprenyl-phosphate GlcNAc-1-phosphate transferase
MSHSYISFFALLLFSLSLNFFLFYKYKIISNIFNLIDDIKNNRKIKKNKGFLVGGIFFFVNIFLFSFLDLFFNLEIFNLKNNELFYFFLTFLFLFILGVCDDKYNLSPYTKLFFLFFIFYFLVTFDNSIKITELRFNITSRNINLGLFSKFLTIFFLLMFLNAFNMFDGINLQCGMYSSLVILLYLLFIGKLEIYYFVLLFLFFFLYWNYKYNVFLGNSGSLLLPFIISYYFIKMYNNKNINFVEEIYIYMCIPGLDMFRLFIIRIQNKRNPFCGDLFHIHHLILAKDGYFYSLMLIQLLVFLTIISGYLISFQFAIFISLFLYLGLLLKYS